ncbi:MAG: alanine--tRNA ligase [Thermodesulfovibrionales bacterium]|nr:alanine--tRNA ligase [Thermodesulfovibrionales bacterium]
MKGTEIRKYFLEFFQAKAHRIIKSSPLIPAGDPTLLFTNAGMVQFKDVFLGNETRPYKRAATCQKCMRAGGKHSDLEQVGHTARHHTFFEMLGNFSFGDYFKREAISFAWELLVGEFRLPKEKLWASVYEEDEEAERLWLELTDIPKERIVRLGAKDNFWQMGDTGPCGPCSEIIIDQGPEVGCGKPECTVGCDCDRYLELWNLVFMQYNRDASGNLTPLPKPSIDTGMGLERITAVLQGKYNNFDTDLFEPIISDITVATDRPYHKSPETDSSIRVIADHLRAIVFLMAEGLIPSNEGRGYVLRRIIRRASRHAHLLGKEEPVLYKLIDSVIDAFGDTYPELKGSPERTRKFLKIEEERFIKTLEQGTGLLDELIVKIKSQGLKSIPGEELFRLYDTFGFPLDLARDIAIDAGLEIDEEGFRSELELQRQRARQSWTEEEITVPAIFKDIPETEFLGYEELSSRGEVLRIFKDGSPVQTLREGEEGILFLNRTTFYGESGGQVGDRGIIYGDSGNAEVIDTKKPVRNLIAHYIKVKEGSISIGENVKTEVNRILRTATMRNHTATHLLHRALKDVLGEHVRQAGSLVSPDRLRFDFTHPAQLEEEEIEEIEKLINSWILENIPVKTTLTTLDEAIRMGAIALFDEKYGDRVRVVEVEGISRELCGGTHVRSTGDIGSFIILSEGSVASGIRRIEALTGMNAVESLRSSMKKIQNISRILSSPEPVEKVLSLLEKQKEMEREIQNLKQKLLSVESSSLLEKARDIDGIKVLSARLDGLETKDLRILGDELRERLKSGIIILGSVLDGQASIITMVTKDLQKRFHAGEILKEIAELAGGRGGGRADTAQGGTKEIDRLDRALELAYDVIRKKKH